MKEVDLNKAPENEVLDHYGCFGANWDSTDPICIKTCQVSERCFKKVADVGLLDATKDVLQNRNEWVDTKEPLLPQLMDEMDSAVLATELQTSLVSIGYLKEYRKDPKMGYPTILGDGTLMPASADVQEDPVEEPKPDIRLVEDPPEEPAVEEEESDEVLAELEVSADNVDDDDDEDTDDLDFDIEEDDEDDSTEDDDEDLYDDEDADEDSEDDSTEDDETDLEEDDDEDSEKELSTAEHIPPVVEDSSDEKEDILAQEQQPNDQESEEDETLQKEEDDVVVAVAKEQNKRRGRPASNKTLHDRFLKGELSKHDQLELYNRCFGDLKIEEKMRSATKPAPKLATVKVKAPKQKAPKKTVAKKTPPKTVKDRQRGQPSVEDLRARHERERNRYEALKKLRIGQVQEARYNKQVFKAVLADGGWEYEGLLYSTLSQVQKQFIKGSQQAVGAVWGLNTKDKPGPKKGPGRKAKATKETPKAKAPKKTVTKKATKKKKVKAQAVASPTYAA